MRGAALVVAAALGGIGGFAGAAAADPCTGISDKGGKFATCFDPGNRLLLTAGSEGFGGELALRHEIHFADAPDLAWRLEHVFVDAHHAATEDRFEGTLYTGTFIRHSRDGHIVIPLGTPKKVFLPFDIGGFVEVGSLRWRPHESARLGIVEAAALVDITRSTSFRRRLAFGPALRWDVDIDKLPRDLGEHHVAPFTTGVLLLHLESSNGRLMGDMRCDAGMVWHTRSGWKPQARAEASLERTMLAIIDRPVALVVGVGYATEQQEAYARIGARIVIAQRRDPRVKLD